MSMKCLTVAVEANFGWPTEKTEIEYIGCRFILMPESVEEEQSVSLICPDGSTMESAKLLVNRFLSALSWTEGEGINVLYAIGSGQPLPTRIGKSKTKFIAKGFKADYLPEPKDDKSKRALALFREAQSVNSPAYSFLGFFKVLNVLFKNGDVQKEWINNNIVVIKGYSSLERLEELKKQHNDLGDYFYVQGRCAVAHSFSEPAVDPDIPSEEQRLSEDLPIIKELAAIAIENELNIISRLSYHGAHLYELQGFQDILGSEVITLLKEGKTIAEVTQIEIPSLSLRLRDSELFQTFEKLTPVSVHQNQCSLIIHLHSDDDILQLVIVLDFKNWRLIFDPIEHVNILDNGTSRPMHVNSETALFAKGKYSNGQIEIYNTETNELLARTDPFIPCNIDLRATIKNLDRISVESLHEAKKRETKNV